MDEKEFLKHINSKLINHLIKGAKTDENINYYTHLINLLNNVEQIYDEIRERIKQL